MSIIQQYRLLHTYLCEIMVDRKSVIMVTSPGAIPETNGKHPAFGPQGHAHETSQRQVLAQSSEDLGDPEDELLEQEFEIADQKLDAFIDLFDRLEQEFGSRT